MLEVVLRVLGGVWVEIGGLLGWRVNLGADRLWVCEGLAGGKLSSLPRLLLGLVLSYLLLLEIRSSLHGVLELMLRMMRMLVAIIDRLLILIVWHRPTLKVLIWIVLVIVC